MALPLAALAATLLAQQITPANVNNLKLAWTFHHGENPAERPKNDRLSFNATPVHVEGKLFVITPKGTAIALDPATGKELWRTSRNGEARRSWGAAYANGKLFFGTPDGKLIALLARNGETLWQTDLRQGLHPCHLSQNMPPTIFNDLVITGGEVPEGTPQGPAPLIRAWRQSDGKLAWQFNTIPSDNDPAAKTWAPGSRTNRTGANVWGQCATDKDTLYCPTGSASYDFYGGDRHGENLYANSVLALDGRTGKLKWHRQLVHHDLWDYDLPAKPLLLTVNKTPALVQVTKMGFLWFLNRQTGEPIFGATEKPVPPSEVPGEQTHPTQPFPNKPPPLSRTTLTEADLNNLTPEWASECRKLYEQSGNFGIFAPWGKDKYTIMLPGTLGGGTWSGAAHDPQRNLIFVNANELGIIGKLAKQRDTWRRISPGTHPRFATSDLVPCTLPPWNTLNAIDVNTGNIAWRIPLGELPQAKAKGINNTGAYGLGGALATQGGVVFIGGTADQHFRAFDSQTGKLLWQHKTNASVYATPMLFKSESGKETIVVSAGGGGFFPGPLSDELLAFQLPTP
ncbi:MAG: quinoprotein glucose dehydrogenase [Acidobacteria bacterium]|nr:quinoprotein glucose dehydrogenase [Acidobacteriota bacterium]